VFEGLLPSNHNEVVMTLLYRLAEWHALAKLRMHTDPTLSLLDSVTTILGQELRRFRRTVCSAYATKDLPKETAARARKKQRDQAKMAKNNTSDSDAHGSSSEATKSSSAQKQKSKSTERKLSITEKNIYLQIIQS
jgi:uncharacterized protein with LGFP repeats